MTGRIPPERGQDGLGASRAVRVWRPRQGDAEDRVVVEEPLEIRVEGTPLAVTLRTPGHDEELASGFVYTEGVIARSEDLARVERVAEGTREAWGNVVDVRLAAGVAPRARAAARPALVSAACGVCGKTTLDAVRRHAPELPDGPRVEAALLASLPERLRASQPVFAETGGLHAAGLFTPAGDLLVAREDVGRHNAVDKVIGERLAAGALPLHDTVLCVSGRAGFEIVQKAWMAGIPIVASVSAPSHLAVSLAEEAHMTLVGFVRGGSLAVYAGRERVAGG